MTIKEAQHIYMVGIKGFGMASLSVILHKMGKHVQGSDVEKIFPTDQLLDRYSIHKDIGFSGELITDDIDLVITTGAHGGLHNEQVLVAKERGIPILTHAEALGETMQLFKTQIAICGTHGKTTTSGLMAYVFHEMGTPSAYQVGTSDVSGLPGGDYTGDDYIVVESDEYVASLGDDNTTRFLYQHPDVAICTNIEFDHPDAYKDEAAVKNAFRKFFENVKGKDGLVVYCEDDKNAPEVAESVDGLKTVSYGFSDDADFRITTYTPDSDGTHITIESELFTESLSLKSLLYGKHNARNVAGIVAALHMMKFDSKDYVQHFGTFKGSKIRFEMLRDDADLTVIDDYAHHPTEIRALMDAVNAKYPDRRTVLVFQPHMVSRTDAFKKEFIEALTTADESFLLDIFKPPREDTPSQLTSEQMVLEAHAMGHDMITYLSEKDAKQAIMDAIQKGDVLVFAGANDKFGIHTQIAKEYGA